MIDGPIRQRVSSLSFDDLAQLRDLCRQILDDAPLSLRNYLDAQSGGYFHVLEVDSKDGNPLGEYSKASTATVVPVLVSTDAWDDSADGDPRQRAQDLMDRVVQAGPWTSAKLPGDNPFTVGFLLELAASLTELGATLSADQQAICSSKLSILQEALVADEGRVRIENELPNSYLTQLCTRVLLKWEAVLPAGTGARVTSEIKELVLSRAISDVHKEMALAIADPAGCDAFELGYAVLLAARLGSTQIRPETRRVLQQGLRIFFEYQKEDGGWPRGRRLFSYPDYGNAYCYEYEFLAQMLIELSDSNVLLPFIPNLRRAIDHLTDEAVSLPRGGYGWPSGHHRQLRFPESWSTASAFHVTHLVDRLIAEVVTDTILEDLKEPRLRLAAHPSWDKFDEILDSTIHLVGDSTSSLKSVLRMQLIEPILAQRVHLAEGKQLSKGTKMSAILYGPPGTSKTTYARAIARALGWQLISIDPSHLLRHGFDQLQAEIGRIFQMLAYAEQVVVFFDEIDELVRDRFGQDEEANSRFLTTSMLPRIMKLRESRRVIFLVATNHLEVFDAAIARPGRFDLVLPVMPPSADEKLKHWKDLADRFQTLQLPGEYKEKLEKLTYDELASCMNELIAAGDTDSFVEVLNRASERGTLNQSANPGKNWLVLISEQKAKVRIA